MKNIPFCTIYLVRHGQSETNLQDIYGLDANLTENGKKQIKQLATRLRHIHFEAIISSTMLRAKQSAEIIALEHNLTVKTYEALKERCYGVLEGKKGYLIQEELKDLFRKRSKLAYEERIKFKFSKNYESDEEVMSRFITSLRELSLVYVGQTILIVSHVTSMKNLLFHLGYASHNELEGQSIDNSGYIKLKSDGVDFFIEEVVGKKKDN